jgi:hypothetical protein
MILSNAKNEFSNWELKYNKAQSVLNKKDFYKSSLKLNPNLIQKEKVETGNVKDLFLAALKMLLFILCLA